ncbi:MAG: hypothetical protein AMXMBFR53_08430 [Gemmatimonadota bacterium]
MSRILPDPGRRAPSGPPDPRFRVLLVPYPRTFREEYGADLVLHLTRQRSEPRYRGRLGVTRFWWDAGWDALGAGLKMRVFGGPYGGGMGTMMDAMGRDLHQALRGLARNPGYVAVFILTLALGIGANTAMFSAVNGVLLRPLPHDDGDQLVYLRQAADGIDQGNTTFSVPEIEDYRRGAPSLEAVAEFSALTFTMLGTESPRRVRAGIVTGNYFEVMGLSATLGRTIGREDDGPTAPAVVVLSDTYWRSVFGADPDILGRTVEINGRSATFVGVAEAAPPYPERTEIYVNMAASPHHLDASMTHDRVHRMTEVFARLAPGATVESARAEVSSIFERVSAEYPEAYDEASGYRVSVTPLKTQLTARARPTLLLLLGTATLVLVIACANLANLTLTRVLRREHELAIRVSLGASRRELRRQLLVESLVLALAGAGLGLLIASVSLGMLVAFAERLTSRASEIQLDAPVFGFALLAAMVATAFFTLLPPLPSNDGVGGGLTRAGARATGGSRAKRTQRALVVAQIATSFVLLIGAGLLARSLRHLTHIETGFDTRQVLAMDIPPNGILVRTDEARNRYLDILEDVRAIPGVEKAALASQVPLSGGAFRIDVAVDGHTPMEGEPAPMAEFRVVSPDYFAAAGIEIVRGREFVSTDVEDGQRVVVVNESMARAYFGDRNPVGQQVAWTDPLAARFLGVGPEWRTIVGVAEDVHDVGLEANIAHTVYNPYPQIRWTGALLVRTALEPARLVPEIRRAILSHDPQQPIENVATLEDLGSRSVAPQRLNATLLGAFALLALVIAAVGIAGVLAFNVGTRKREFGVRSALGAARHQIGSSVLVEGLTLAALGVAIGSVAAVGLTRFISGLLVGVPALDPVTFVGVGLLLGGIAVASAWWPAWRAAAVDPVEALGAE